MENIQVIKRDGSKELFTIHKIARVMGAAGLSTSQTETVVQHISDWLSTLSTKEITSKQIRDKLLEILPSVDQQSAELFSWYQKTKKE